MATNIPNINGAVIAGIGTGTEISDNSTRRSVSGFMPAPSTLSTALRTPAGSLLINSGPSRAGRVDSFLTGFRFSSSSIRSFAAESAGEQMQAHSSAQGIENLVIVGSGPAGYTAAIYAARANLKPVVFEGFQVGGVPGGQLMTTTEVENFPGFPDGITGPDLMDRMRRQAEQWGGELFQEDVEFIDVKNTPFTVRSSDVCFGMREFSIVTGLNCHFLDVYDEEKLSTKTMREQQILDVVEKSCKENELVKHLKSKDARKGVKKSLCLLYFVHNILCGKDLNTKIAPEWVLLSIDRYTFFAYPRGRVSYDLTIKYLLSAVNPKVKTTNLYGFPWAFMIKCHSLIIATGARAQRLRLPREDEFWSRGISACAICDGASPLFKGQVLAVVGGGDTATEEAIYLTKYASHVHLLVRRDQLRASKAMQDRVFNNPNITVHFNTETVDIVSNSKGQMSGILIRTVDTGEESVLEAKGLFYGIGHSPNSKLLEGQVELDSAGYILVKESTAKTSVEGVFAAGDVRDHEWRQAVTAAGSGCLAALSVERYLTSKNLLVEFHQPQAEDNKKELTEKDVQEGFDITYAKHKGQYALRKLYHESPRLLCVLYTSPSCGPCRTLKPILSKVIDEFDQHVHFVEIDITEDPEIAEAAEIMGTPCVQFFKNKEMLRTISGVKMKREYRELIGANK